MSSNKKKHVSVVFIGHVDSGKSTTTGHLIYKCGGIDKRTMERLEKEAERLGRTSFKFAFVLDSLKEERERGITINIKQTRIETQNSTITIVDAPGHRDFLKNMVTGASVADAAVLVLPAGIGEFATAIGPGGTAREHATLAYTMGVRQICIVINKMDDVGYDQKIYENCIKEAFIVAQKAGFQKDTICFLPVSGLVGDNLNTVSENMPWFKGWNYTLKHPSQGEVKISGKTLYDWCDTLLEPYRPVDKPLRVVVDGVYKIGGVGTVAAGRVESGSMKPGDVVTFCPVGITTEVKSIEMHHTALEVATCGDSIGFNVKGVSIKDIRRGNVVGHVNKDPPRKCVSFVAQTVIINATGGKDNGFHMGFSPVCDAHTDHFIVKVVNILHKIDRRTGKNIEVAQKDKSVALKNGEVGMVAFEPARPVCLEVYSDYPALGRMAIREGKKTIAVSVIKEIVKADLDLGKSSAAKAGGAGKGKK